MIVEHGFAAFITSHIDFETIVVVGYLPIYGKTFASIVVLTHFTKDTLDQPKLGKSSIILRTVAVESSPSIFAFTILTWFP